MSSDRKPAPMPSIWGMVRRKPKFTPDANSIMLFGPGVIEVVKANRIKARKVSSGMTSPDAKGSLNVAALSFRGRPVDGLGAFAGRFKQAWHPSGTPYL